MKRFYLIAVLCLFLTACFWDEPIEVTHLTKDFNLAWWYDSRHQNLFLNTNHNEYGGVAIIPETVYALGYNDNFIIAKQYPNLQKALQKRLFAEGEEGEGFRILNPADTIYLSKEDRIYQKNGEWYHTSNGWNPPPHLFPYKDSTYFYIVDIRSYENIKAWDIKENIYRLDDQEAFRNKRAELGVSTDLEFTIFNEELE
jgi:hypothetical protein